MARASRTRAFDPRSARASFLALRSWSPVTSSEPSPWRPHSRTSRYWVFWSQSEPSWRGHLKSRSTDAGPGCVLRRSGIVESRSRWRRPLAHSEGPGTHSCAPCHRRVFRAHKSRRALCFRQRTGNPCYTAPTRAKRARELRRDKPHSCGTVTSFCLPRWGKKVGFHV